MTSGPGPGGLEHVPAKYFDSFILVCLQLDFLLDFCPAERASGREGVFALPAAADVAARQEQDITLLAGKKTRQN